MKALATWFIIGILRFIVFTTGRILFRFHVEGRENVPAGQGCFIVFNHASYLDFIIAACTVPGKVSFIMNAAVYHKPSLNWIFKAAGCIPVSSSLNREAREDFNREVSARIAEGRVVCIFAEGTVTRTGHLLTFRKGIEHLVRETGAPVLPAHIHNVVGAPFSWLPSGGRLVKFSWRRFRRPVWVAFGEPVLHPVNAFQLRQEVRNLEAGHFAGRFASGDTLSLWLGRKIRRSAGGFWKSGTSHQLFSELSHVLPELRHALKESLQMDKAVAILLPPSPESFSVILYLLSESKVIVPLDPEWSNEERLFVCNSCGVGTIITSRDLGFTKWTPVTARAIYVEDIMEAVRSGNKAGCFIHSWRRTGIRMIQNFRGEHRSEDVAMIFHDRTANGELSRIPLSNLNLLCAVQSIGQSYFFDGGVALHADLPVSQPAGIVLQVLVPVMFDVPFYHLAHPAGEQSVTNFLFLSPNQMKSVNPDAWNTERSIVFTEWSDSEYDIRRWKDAGHMVHPCGNLQCAGGIFSVNLNNFRGIDIEGREFEQEAGDESSIGKPLPGMAASVGDNQGPYETFEPGQTGVLWLKGAAISKSSDGFESDNSGWCNTGRHVCITESGFIRPVTPKMQTS